MLTERFYFNPSPMIYSGATAVAANNFIFRTLRLLYFVVASKYMIYLIIMPINSLVICNGAF